MWHVGLRERRPQRGTHVVHAVRLRARARLTQQRKRVVRQPLKESQRQVAEADRDREQHQGELITAWLRLFAQESVELALWHSGFDEPVGVQQALGGAWGRDGGGEQLDERELGVVDVQPGWIQVVPREWLRLRSGVCLSLDRGGVPP